MCRRKRSDFPLCCWSLSASCKRTSWSEIHLVLAWFISLSNIHVVSSSPDNKCTSTGFFCPEGYCIPISWKCDKYIDCRNGDDENNCPWSLLTSHGDISDSTMSPLVTNSSRGYQPDISEIRKTFPSTFFSSPSSTSETHKISTAKVSPTPVNPTSTVTQNALTTSDKNQISSTKDTLFSDSSTTAPKITTSTFSSRSTNSTTRPTVSLFSILQTSVTVSAPVVNNATTMTPCPSRFGFRCLSGACVSTGAWCNGVSDCSDGSDEPMDCFQHCAPNMHQCSNGNCIPQSEVCDGRNACGDYSDEFDCDCKVFEFQCQLRGICKDIALWCDGHPDCPDGSDEASACSQICPANWFLCDKNRCLSSTYICDGVSNCMDQTDEANCDNFGTQVSFTLYREALKAKYNGDDGYFICAEGWTTSLSDLVCRSANCNSSIATESVLQENGNSKFLLAVSPVLLHLKPGLCVSHKAIKLSCSCNSQLETAQEPLQFDWPWHVSVFNLDGYLCSGVIVNSQWVLAAANCFIGNRSRVGDVSVKVGSINLWNSEQLVVQVSEIMLHPNFKEADSISDIALVRLSEKLKFSSKIQALRLQNTAVIQSKAVCVTINLGAEASADISSAINMIPTFMTLLKADNCLKTVSNLSTSQSLICAQHQQDEDVTSCNRLVSGSSQLVCLSSDDEWTLYGVSARKTSEFADSVAVFQQISEFSNWIRLSIANSQN